MIEKPKPIERKNTAARNAWGRAGINARSRREAFLKAITAAKNQRFQKRKLRLPPKFAAKIKSKGKIVSEGFEFTAVSRQTRDGLRIFIERFRQITLTPREMPPIAAREIVIFNSKGKFSGCKIEVID